MLAVIAIMRIPATVFFHKNYDIRLSVKNYIYPRTLDICFSALLFSYVFDQGVSSIHCQSNMGLILATFRRLSENTKGTAISWLNIIIGKVTGKALTDEHLIKEQTMQISLTVTQLRQWSGSIWGKTKNTQEFTVQSEIFKNYIFSCSFHASILHSFITDLNILQLIAKAWLQFPATHTCPRGHNSANW